MSSRRLVVAAVIVDDLVAPSRVLATRRSHPEALAGRWEFPGGKVEPRETPQAALVREIVEELGVGVRLGGEVEGPDGGPWPIDERYAMRVWLATVPHGEARAGDSHDVLRWVGVAELGVVDWLDADVPVAARVAQLLARQAECDSAATDEGHRGGQHGQVRDVGSER